MSGESAREIGRLAIPTLGALLVSPTLMLADSAIIGHWSTDALAGLGLAQTILLTIVGLCIFLAYSTTASTARALGAGHTAKGIKLGIDAIWLALILGLLAIAVLVPAGAWLLTLFGADPSVTTEASKYLRVSALGMPAMLAVQAATGVIRGLQDARTPLLIALSAAVLNVPLSILLVFVVGWGIVGAGVGTVICEYLMASTLVVIVGRQAVAAKVSLRPEISGVANAWRDGLPLLVRTISMRIALILLSVGVARLGTVQLAAHQVVWNIWGFLVNALDSLAIAAQALTGKYLGRSEVDQLHAVSAKMARWGVAGGTIAAVVVLGASWVVPTLFSNDVSVQSAIRVGLFVVVLCQPLAGYVYVLDGVLMGAGDAWYLAKVAIFNLAIFLPAIWWLVGYGPKGNLGLACIWLSWGGWFMAARAVTLWLRYRSDAWVRVGG